MSLLSPEELARLSSAESLFPSPIPVQSVSSDEFMPAPQTGRQREFEARVRESGTRLAKRLGMSRRRFFQTASGMAAAFVAMNDTYGPLFSVSSAEAATPEAADERAKRLSGQFIIRLDRCLAHCLACSFAGTLEFGPSDHKPIVLDLQIADARARAHPLQRVRRRLVKIRTAFR